MELNWALASFDASDERQAACIKLSVGSTDPIPDRWYEQSSGTASRPPEKPLFVVVGFNGTVPARRALDSAVDLLQSREGGLEVVYVADRSEQGSLGAEVGVDEGDDHSDQERVLAHEVRSTLVPTHLRWRFQRRDGNVAEQLAAIAETLRENHGPDASVVIALGVSSHSRHRDDGSAVSNLRRDGRFPVIVLPRTE
jgi:nucleotide-binding universal stress UspA family protein